MDSLLRPPPDPAAALRDDMISVIIPACNEERQIGPCLTTLLASDAPRRAVDIIVVANGCTDATAATAARFAPQAAARGWLLTVLDLPQGGKPAALNAGDSTATGALRAYLDADVTVSPPLLAQLCRALDRPAPAYASGTLCITAPESRVSRAYARLWSRVPFMSRGVPGCGLFAVNRAGRARWGAFPAIISDDTFVRLHFTPAERHAVPAPYDWPVAPGLSALVRVRRRQDRGVAEIARAYPALMANEDKLSLGLSGSLRLAAVDPGGFAVYSAVALAVRATPDRDQGWSRSR
jgi:glycosyltransferase involved in cell wall biosynthesis